MVLHIYNPEHDIALGKNTDFFTPPKAARLTRDAFCHRPALWANDGDLVLVDDVALAESNLSREKQKHPMVRFVTKSDLAKLKTDEMPTKVEPWGWDRFVVAQLLRCNPLFASLVPSNEKLEDIRRFSSRQFVSDVLLPRILSTNCEFVGNMVVCHNEEDINLELQKNNGSIVIKSPWSCSGRGVRFICGALTANELGWIRNVLTEQKVIIVEPQYDKVMDFAMEFYAGKENVEYRGLNVFETRGGAYLGNVEGSQEEKMDMLSRYVSLDVIEQLKNDIIAITYELFQDKYEGPFGIDMMIVLDGENKTKVHPCVEMNLRRTMGQI